MAMCPVCNGTMFNNNKFCSAKCYKKHYGANEEEPLSSVSENKGYIETQDLED